MPNRTLFYADGLRWIGSIFNGAADKLERNVGTEVVLDPRALSRDRGLRERRARARAPQRLRNIASP
jgi:hypothetical protein